MFLAFPASVRDTLLTTRFLFAHAIADPPGNNREVKKAVEAYWAGKITEEELYKAAAEVKKVNWEAIKAHGVDLIPRCVRSSFRLTCFILIVYSCL